MSESEPVVAPRLESREDSQQLERWFRYIQTLHSRSIDLSLARVRAVYSEICPQGAPFLVVSIAGTNGKGSLATMVESIFRCAGYKTGLYTSPHLVRFNERFRINGEPIADANLLFEFERIEAARKSIPLTFFEFGTLIAVDYFQRQQVDVAVMEIGLGGRLDAVNVLDAEIACITQVGLDHTKWLGSTREKIGYEKSGIMRSGKPVICVDENPPQSVLMAAKDRNVQLLIKGSDFQIQRYRDSWNWKMNDGSSTFQIEQIPSPPVAGRFQFDNCAGAVAVAVTMRRHLNISDDNIRLGIRKTAILGRLQHFASQPEIVLDVAHNTEAVAAMVEYLLNRPIKGRTLAVMSALSEKPIESMVRTAEPLVDGWYVCAIPESSRGISRDEIHGRVTSVLGENVSVRAFNNVIDAFNAAKTSVTADDRIIVFGSFITVGDIIKRHQSDVETSTQSLK